MATRVHHFFILLGFFHSFDRVSQSIAPIKSEESVLLPGDVVLKVLALQSSAELGVFEVIQHLQALWKPAGCILVNRPSVWLSAHPTI